MAARGPFLSSHLCLSLEPTAVDRATSLALLSSPSTFTCSIIRYQVAVHHHGRTHARPKRVSESIHRQSSRRPKRAGRALPLFLSSRRRRLIPPFILAFLQNTSTPRATFSTLQARLTAAQKTNDTLADVFKERVAIEQAYVASLQKLASKRGQGGGVIRDGLGAFAGVWEKVWNEVNEVSVVSARSDDASTLAFPRPLARFSPVPLFVWHRLRRRLVGPEGSQDHDLTENLPLLCLPDRCHPRRHRAQDEGRGRDSAPATLRQGGLGDPPARQPPCVRFSRLPGLY